MSGWQEVDTLLALRPGSLRACKQRLGEQEAFGSAMLETYERKASLYHSSPHLRDDR